MSDPEQKKIEKGTYRHSKSGKLYEVLGVALQTETDKQLVIYQPLYECEHELFARPYDMFVGTVEIDGKIVPRFEKIKSKSSKIKT